MKKSNKKGFTLVELVVVIAIIGILAAILVPTMMNYVAKAKLKSANSNAKLIFTTVNNQIADMIVEGKTVTAGTTTGTVNALPTGDLNQAVKDALKDNGSSAGYCSFVVVATGAEPEVTLAQWGENATATVRGQYPDPINDPKKVPASMTWGSSFAAANNNQGGN